ncbi:MAG TPA: hypothetical protein DDZ80_29610 [Cyanobacteria bacterium UBA8803]|nr:hypothetical protein [Cyanobacteria bacterium UBA9273]HBL62400.1 hypothetical protein [Cyanobacteria bacterium UBA8803]
MTKLVSKHTAWFRFLAISLLVLGIVLRFVNLDHKVYWHDETYTSLVIAGYTQKEFVQQVFDGRVIGVEDLQKYQRPNPNKGLRDTLTSLAIDNPQHFPLYYVTAKFWVQMYMFGNIVAVIRSLSVLISLLIFPCIYWLCLELFESPLVGWVAIAVLSVSPFHVLYAQEARPYSLWTVTTLLSSAALLRALRLSTRLNWGIYAVTLALSFYSYLFSGFVAIAHGIYVAALDGFRLTQKKIAYILAAIAGLLAFFPWLFIFVSHLYSVAGVTSWTAIKMPLFALIRIWLGNLSRLFFDINLDSNAPLIYILIAPAIAFVLILYSLYFVYRQAPQRTRLFIFLLIGVNALALILPDLILGGRRSSVSRYLIPCYLGIQLAVSYLLAEKLRYQQSDKVFSSKLSTQTLWQVVLVTVISCGVVSNIFIAQADTWWIKKNSHNHPQAARIINRSPRPLLVSSDYNVNVGEILSFSYLLNPKTKLQLVTEPTIPQIPEGFSDLFIFNLSRSLREKLANQQNYKIQTVQPSKLRLGKLIKQ